MPDQLSDALVFSGELSSADSRRVLGWNPYSANREAAPFFDAGWMFGLAAAKQRPSAATLRGNLAAIINQTAGQMELGAAPASDGAANGFDLVLGNPPYVRQEELKNVSVQDSAGRPRRSGSPEGAIRMLHWHCRPLRLFHRALASTPCAPATSSASSPAMRAFAPACGGRLRTYLLYSTRPRVLLDFGDAPLFTAIAYPCIIVTQKARHINKGDLPDPEEFKLADRVKQLLVEPDRTLRVMTWTPGSNT